MVLRELSSISQDLDALEKQETFVGHHKTLLFFRDDRVGKVFSIKVLGEGPLVDKLFNSLRGCGHHIGVETGVVLLLLVASKVNVCLWAIEVARPIEGDIGFRSRVLIIGKVILSGKLALLTSINV